MERSSRSNKLQNALFDDEINENNIFFKKPSCCLKTLIRIILSDAPFEKTLLDIFYGIRGLFPYFLSPSSSNIYNLKILEKALKNSNDVTEVKLVNRKNKPLPTKYFVLKDDVAFSYKIEDIIGPKNSLNEYTKISSDRFLKLLYRETKSKGCTWNNMERSYHVEPLLEQKHNYLTTNRKNFETPCLIRFLHKIKKNSRTSRKIKLIDPPDISSSSRNRQNKSGNTKNKKYKSAMKESLGKAEKKFNKYDFSSSQLDRNRHIISEIKPHKNLQSNYTPKTGCLAVDSTVSPACSNFYKDDGVEVHKQSDSEHRPKQLSKDPLLSCDVNAKVNSFHNFPCRFTIAGCEVSIGTEKNNLNSVKNNITNNFLPSSVTEEKLSSISKNAGIQSDFRIENPKIVDESDLLLPLRVPTCRGIECTSMPILELSQTNNTHPILSSEGKTKNLISHEKLLSKNSSQSKIMELQDLSDSVVNASFDVSRKTNELLNRDHPIDIQMETNILQREVQPRESSSVLHEENYTESAGLSISHPLSYSIPKSELCGLFGKFNVTPDEVIIKPSHMQDICPINLDETNFCNELPGTENILPHTEKHSYTEPSLEIPLAVESVNKTALEKSSLERKKLNAKKNLTKAVSSTQKKLIKKKVGKDTLLGKKNKKKVPLNILQSVVNLQDISRLNEQTGDKYHNPEPNKNVLDALQKVIFVKGKDLKCVLSETFQQYVSDNNIPTESRIDDCSSQKGQRNEMLVNRAGNTYLGMGLSTEPASASEEGGIIRSYETERSILKSNTNNSIRPIRYPASIPSVVIANKSPTTGCPPLSYEANLSVENTTLFYKRKSIEDLMLNKLIKFDEPSSKISERCVAKSSLQMEAEKQIEYVSSSLMVRDLDKDIISLHVKLLKKMHRWLRYDYTRHSFSCKLCSYDVGDSSFEMGTIKIINCVGQLNLNYFYCRCMEHSTSDFHRLSGILKKNPRVFKAIKFLLMNCLQNFLSIDDLIKELKVIFKDFGSSISQDALINLIEIVRSLNEKQMLFMVRQLNMPVSFMLDFCKDIAIMRFVLFTGEPIEYALVIGHLNVRSSKSFLQAINICERNVIIIKILDKCGRCSYCDFTPRQAVGKPLPIRFPSVKDLLQLIQEDKRFGNLFKFSKGISQLYTQFPQKFVEVEGVNVLQKYQISLWPTLEFALREREKLKEVCDNIFKGNGNVIALGLAKFPLHFEEDIAKCLDTVRTVCIQVLELQKSCELNTAFVDQLSLCFHNLFKNISESIDVDESVRLALSNFVLENSKNECCNGRQYINDFEFLTFPSTLIALSKSPKSEDNLKKIYYLVKPFIKEDLQKLIEDLQSFGQFLFHTFADYCIPFNDILKIFHEHEHARQKFPLSHTFYYVVGTLPFFPAYVEQSVYNTWNTCTKFVEKFGKGVGFNLAMIHLQQRDLPLLKSNLTCYCLKPLIENLKISEKLKK